jgi:hypothetical protein
MGVGFSETYDKKWSFTWPASRYICAECEKAHERIEKLPDWYLRMVGRRAEAKRSRDLERAAEKARHTGNPNDARLPDGNGWVSRVQ